jgi:hypothetical protein
VRRRLFDPSNLPWAVSQRPFDPYRAGAKVYRAYWADRRPTPQTILNGRWKPSLEFFTLPTFQAKASSRAWNKVGSSWHLLVKEISRARPLFFEEVISEPL